MASRKKPSPMNTSLPSLSLSEQEALPAYEQRGETPRWMRAIEDTFSSAASHVMLLHGEVRGRGATGRKHLDELQHVLASRFALVLRYDLEAGISCLLSSMREPALRLLSDVPLSVGKSAGDLFAQASLPLDALTLLEALLRHPECKGKVAVILDYAEMICPMREKGQMSEEERAVLIKLLKWGRDEQLMQSGNAIFLIAGEGSELHAELRAGATAIEIAPPTLEERAHFLSLYLRHREEKGRPITLHLPLRELANLTPGLSLWNLEDLLLLGARRGGVSRALVREHKQSVISAQYQGVADLIDPLPGGFASIGGMDHLISWVEDELVGPLRCGRLQEVPKGILLVGPPGNGKTLLMQALAAELGFNAVALRMENVLGGIVGESERKLQMLFRLVERLAPALLLFDEADQSDVARRGQGSGNPVASNLFGQMLQFVGDEQMRGKVILVMASNRPDLFDPALLRPGRMDAIIPIFAPSPSARRSILLIQAKRAGVDLLEPALTLLVERTDGASGADLSALIKKASKLAKRSTRQTITAEDASLALSFIRCSTRQQTEYYTQLARSFCSDSELIPPEQQSRSAEMVVDSEASSGQGQAVPLWREARGW